MAGAQGLMVFGATSGGGSVTSGAAQGSSLRPVQFSICINHQDAGTESIRRRCAEDAALEPQALERQRGFTAREVIPQNGLPGGVPDAHPSLGQCLRAMGTMPLTTRFNFQP